MAARSSSGIGVVVSLVIFIVISVVLLVLTIAFYSGQTRERENAAEAQRTMDRYITAQQRQTDFMRSAESAAAAQNKSVALYLRDMNERLKGLVEGNPSATIEEIQSKFTRLGVEEGKSIYGVMQTSVNGLRDAGTAMATLEERITERDNEITNLRARLTEAQRACDEKVAAVEQLYASANAEIQDGMNQMRELRQSLDDAKDQLRDEYEGQIADLETQLDQALRDNAVIGSRVDELEKTMNKFRTRPTNMAELVDGKVIEVAGSNDQVYIDRGRMQRIVLGMTFEVYDDMNAIRPMEDGTMPRGKASLEVIKVGDTTSTCKITRAIPGRPVLRNDVIANAVYDPTYKFKFLIHGKFDVDGDGRASEAEARYLESLVLEWGGTIVSGDQIPGDLDFLVLGLKPTEPPPLRVNAAEVEMEIYITRRQEVETYERLFRQASEAQIPVLNANRFFILIGHTQR